ncbi:hypothetical protein UA08_07371 [Talaromyces atroroseus]|uniref:Uncharacterized protein n=1 Tax=Talaromyces atroroseus TaxID=1441469 RepID=A0A225AQ26_TALAT|nr:hypothetical protein UA08_07371 [Talaromyces atroroseus]OKL57046.1 hypothetical protein UA08_07371 [Talaromyces atroroseus]
MTPLILNHADDDVPPLDKTFNGYSTLPNEYHHGCMNGNPLKDDKTMPIAIVGMSFRGPADATNVESLWEMICERREGWSEVPKERWNNDAFYHPDNTRHGTVSVEHFDPTKMKCNHSNTPPFKINVKGGHFFSEDLAHFDAPFFNMTNAEAAALDPQQRLLLEGTFEALENGGITLEKIMGSKTSCFVGSFSGDYTDMLLRDPDSVPMYQCTNAGQSRAITANRISYFFDLKGPSVTVDTACSGSLVALHLACQSIRTGDAKTAIAAGVNTVLSHEFMSTMSMMRFLSPDGRCYTFDERANGYARGEGVGCLILKPLKDALRDNDTIRAVIRGSGSNQDGKTSGITLPSGAAQEELVRNVYEAAGLDPLETEYVEAHGTGTQAGDPQETGALSRVFCPGRSSDKPLRVGSIKTNVGHLEGASGIAGVIKATMMLENRMFLPNRNFETLNPRIPLDLWKLKVQLDIEPWETDGPHRVSVNSFGYGGSNAHVILEDAAGYLKSHEMKGYYRNPKAIAPRDSKEHSNSNHTTDESSHSKRFTNAHSDNILNGEKKEENGHSQRKQLLVLSSFDEASGKRQSDRLQKYLLARKHLANEEFMTNLAFTLNNRRTSFMWKVAISGSNVQEVAQTLSKGVKFSRAMKKPTLGFVFTGQGAQWCGMGKELLAAYPVFSDSINKIGAYLKSLGAPFDVKEEITRDPSGSQINLALYSQPMCSAVQIAIVDLLYSWGIKPASVTGHSSGEIAAAYTAGVLSMEDAMAVAYYRGVASTLMLTISQTQGAMMAVGLSKEDAEPYLSKLQFGKAVIACVNSPSSITISGDVLAIDELKGILDDQKIFARKLAVEVAYHSHHMQLVSEEYYQLISKINTKIAADEITESVEFFSSVTGSKAVASELGPNYWVKNMLGQVKFADSVRQLCLETTDPTNRTKGAGRKTRKRAGAATKASVDHIIEIGPHSALAGPIKQIIKANETLSSASIAYSSALVRKVNAVSSILDLAGNLVMAGWPLDLIALNSPHGVGTNYERQALVDLPPYPWNHSNTYWAEPRLSKVYRNRKFPRTDLLGVLDRYSSPLEPRWRNHIRTTEIPWVNDHKIQSNIVYPAAGYIVMAIEAMHQWMPEHYPEGTISGYTLREVNIGAALVISEQSAVEVMISLRPYRVSARGVSKVWREFSILSVTEENKWTEHSSGLICAHFEADTSNNLKQDAEVLHQTLAEIYAKCDMQVNVNEFYKHLRQLGLEYGETFANMTEAYSATDSCVAEITISDTAATMPMNFQYPFVIHPSTLDSMFHPIFVALSAERGLIQDPAVPIAVDEVYVSNSLKTTPGHRFSVYVCTEKKDESNIVASIVAVDKEEDVSSHMEHVGLSIKGLTCRVLPREVGNGTDEERERTAYNIKWNADPELLSAAGIASMCTSSQPSEDDLQQLRLYEKCSSVYVADAVSQLDSKDIPAEKPHIQKLWKLLKASNIKISVSDDEKAWITEQTKRSGPEGELLCTLGDNLLSILRDGIDPWNIMMTENRLDAYLNDTSRLVRNYKIAAKYVRLLGNKNPQLSLLEIGAGTGEASLPILQALSEGNTSVWLKRYTFTDLNTDMFEVAQKKLSDWADLIKFKEFDVAGSLEEQGFKSHSYDVVILGHGIHLAKSTDRMLKNIRNLLKDEGKFIFVDEVYQNESIERSLVSGTFSSLWEDDVEGKYRVNAYTEDDWHQALLDARFSGMEVCLRDAASHGSSVMISKAVGDGFPSPALDILLITEDGDCGVSESSLLDHLKTAGARVETCRFNEAHPDGRTCIVLSDLSFPVLAKSDATAFEIVKSLFLHSTGVLWVTRGGSGLTINPNASLITGFARTARAEADGANIVTLDLDGQTPLSPERAAETIASLFRHRFVTRANTTEQDVEYAERQGIISIPRVTESIGLNRDLESILGRASPTTQALYQPGRKLRPIVATATDMNSMHFVDEPMQQLPDDYVQIEVRASGINKSDSLLARGQRPLGAECSGIVCAIGKSVMDLSVGDRVLCLGSGTITNYHQDKESAFQKVPEDMSFEHAAALPAAYCTAYYVVYNLARIVKTDSVLIHNIAEPTGQAILELCNLIGARVFGTVSEASQKKYVVKQLPIPEENILYYCHTTFAKEIIRMTNKKGVDVLVNCLDGDTEMRRFSWSCVASYGRFIDLGSRGIADNSRLEMGNFAKNSLFASFDLLSLLKEKTSVAQKVWADVMCLFRTKAIRGFSSLLVHDVSDIGKALTEMESGGRLGKTVIVAKPGSVVKALPRDKSGELLRNDMSYLLVGGLGGIGRATASWMIDRGAKFIIFANRSGLSREESKDTIRQLEAKGAKVAVYSCDIIDESDVIGMVKSASREMPPIKGVIQAAMVLRDTLIENMSFEEFSASLKPKFNGTWNLHNHLPKNMDFFVMLSSISGVIGNASQAAYAAGNTFMDAFAGFRNSLGLPAVALDLGVITGVGYLSQNTELLAAMERQGFQGTDERTLMALIQTAISQPHRQDSDAQIVTGLGSWKDGKSLGNFDQAIFSHFRRQFSGGENSSEEGTSADQLKENLRACKTLEEAASVICAALIEHIAARLETPAENINSSKSLSDYSIDSLVAVEIRTWIAKEMSSTIPILELLASSSLLQLSEKIATRSTLVKVPEMSS